MQDNAERMKELGLLAELVYQTKYFLVTNPDIIVDKADHKQLENSYTVLGVSTDVSYGYNSGFQGMLLENNAPKAGEPKYVIAFRGTEPDQGFGELKKDLLIADIAYMGTGRVPQQMKDAMDFVERMKVDYGINSSNTNFTGHSLGGAIAGMASYVYGFETYTYNGFGIKNMLWDVNDTSSNYSAKELMADELEIVNSINPLTGLPEFETLGEYLEANNITIKHEENKITNIIHIGHARTDLVGGIATDIVSGQIGENHFVVNNTGAAGGFLNTHSKTNLNNSIAIYNNILPLFPNENYNSLTDIVMDISPDNRKIERFLDSLGELGSVTPKTSDLVAWSESIGTSGLANLTLTLSTLTEPFPSNLVDLAQNKHEYLYALTKLNPYTITGEGVDYSFLDDEVFSDQYLEDRTAFLFQLIHPETPSSTGDDIKYKDDQLLIDTIIASNGSPDLTDRHYTFGSVVSDTLELEGSNLYS